MKNINRLCWVSIPNLRPTNKRPNNKEKDLVRAFFKKSITLLYDWSKVMLITNF